MRHMANDLTIFSPKSNVQAEEQLHNVGQTQAFEQSMESSRFATKTHHLMEKH